MSNEPTAAGTVGTRLRALREAMGLSQRALAALAGVAPETVARLEGDWTPTRLATLRKIAATLGVPPEALAGGRPAADKAMGVLPRTVRTALVAGGVPPGPAGYDASALLAAIAARGWHATVEELAPSQGGRKRYRAMVFGPAGGGHPTHVSARARGATEEDALAAALARLLERTG
jgi:transcriptional regulator with XRE-family HTH domain